MLLLHYCRERRRRARKRFSYVLQTTRRRSTTAEMNLPTLLTTTTSTAMPGSFELRGREQGACPPASPKSAQTRWHRWVCDVLATHGSAHGGEDGGSVRSLDPKTKRRRTTERYTFLTEIRRITKRQHFRTALESHETSERKAISRIFHRIIALRGYTTDLNAKYRRNFVYVRLRPA